MGDGSFLMNVQEIETAVRVGARMVVLVWVDKAYGLIKWKMNIHNARTRMSISIIRMCWSWPIVLERVVM